MDCGHKIGKCVIYDVFGVARADVVDNGLGTIVVVIVVDMGVLWDIV